MTAVNVPRELWPDLPHRTSCQSTGLAWVPFLAPRGDVMRRCAECGARVVVKPAEPSDEPGDEHNGRRCTRCQQMTGNAKWNFCPSCKQAQKVERSAPAPLASTGRPHPANLAPQAAPTTLLRYCCPDCLEQPARDQRAGNRDGRCGPCWRTATDPKRHHARRSTADGWDQ